MKKETTMSKQVVLITGALTGIGRATALAFAHDGAQVVVSGRRDDAGIALAEEIRNTGVEAEFIGADVRHEGDIRALVAIAVLDWESSADFSASSPLRRVLPAPAS
jgi:NAD(P)-dependent dehydrogenase (short-subunit alcohol dehydrogenase family)